MPPHNPLYSNSMLYNSNNQDEDSQSKNITDLEESSESNDSNDSIYSMIGKGNGSESTTSGSTCTTCRDGRNRATSSPVPLTTESTNLSTRISDSSSSSNSNSNDYNSNNNNNNSGTHSDNDSNTNNNIDANDNANADHDHEITTHTATKRYRSTTQRSSSSSISSNITGFHNCEVDDLLSKEMLQLSFQDRNAINEEIHGVNCLAPDETPKLVYDSLRLLQIEIDTMSAMNSKYKSSNYDVAQKLYATKNAHTTDDVNMYVDGDVDTSTCGYINTNDFRLMFLRCELFNIQKTAVRFMKYLDLIVKFYGIVALQRPIKLSDFSKYELQILRAGYYQIWPFRDRSGRRILSIAGNLGMQYDPSFRLKVYFYFWMVASTDVETQRKGIIFLVWPTVNEMIKNGNFKQTIPNPTDRRLHTKCNDAAPLRICAVHFCLPNSPFFHLLRSVMTMTLRLSQRSRLRFHVGEGVELQYALKGYGVPTENLPITDSGNVKTSYLKTWMRVRKIIEVQMTSSGRPTKSLSIIECPRSVDVIFRPGTSMLSHPGNHTFRGLIEAKQDRITIKKQDKEQVAIEIIQEISINLGGRFLIWDNTGYWSDISNDRATCVEKIAVSYRDYKTKIRHYTAAAAANNNTALVHATISNSNDIDNNNNNTQKQQQQRQNAMDCSTSVFLGQQEEVAHLQDGCSTIKKRKRSLAAVETATKLIHMRDVSSTRDDGLSSSSPSSPSSL